MLDQEVYGFGTTITNQSLPGRELLSYSLNSRPEFDYILYIDIPAKDGKNDNLFLHNFSFPAA